MFTMYNERDSLISREKNFLNDLPLKIINQTIRLNSIYFIVDFLI